MTEPPSAPPEFSESEEQSSEKLLRNMGHVMTAWQGVEHAVFDVIKFFFDPNHYDVAAATFFAVQAFETRMQVVDALMEQLASKDQCLRWELIHGKIREKSKCRNIVAHGSFVLFGARPNRKAALSRSVYDITRFPDNPRFHEFVPANELVAAAESFSRVSKDVFDFLNELKKDAGLPLKLRARPQCVEVNVRKHPLTVRLPSEP